MDESMNIKLIEITLDTLEKIPVKKKFLWFHITKKVNETYKYWIEFRVDEKRYWYGELKPVFNHETNAYEYKQNFIMTKNGLKKSISLIEGIEKRILDLYPNAHIDKFVNKKVYQGVLEKYDKVEEKTNIKGMFLSD